MAIGRPNRARVGHSDSNRIFIDFATAPGAIQPIYLTPDRTAYSHLDNWSGVAPAARIGFCRRRTPSRLARLLGPRGGDRPRPLRLPPQRIRRLRLCRHRSVRGLSTTTPTPNGDQINDVLQIDYTLLRLPEPVSVASKNLCAQLVAPWWTCPHKCDHQAARRFFATGATRPGTCCRQGFI